MDAIFGWSKFRIGQVLRATILCLDENGKAHLDEAGPLNTHVEDSYRFHIN